jgi:hypothetical protein
MRPLNGIIPKALIGRRNRVGLLYQGRFKAILVERVSDLLALCRLYRAHPLRVKSSGRSQTWKWSGYRATAGPATVPEFLSTDWILAQFRKKQGSSAEAVPGICQDIFVRWIRAWIWMAPCTRYLKFAPPSRSRQFRASGCESFRRLRPAMFRPPRPAHFPKTSEALLCRQSPYRHLRR